MSDEDTRKRLDRIERMLERILEIMLEMDEEDEGDEDLFERAMKRRDWEKWVL